MSNQHSQKEELLKKLTEIYDQIEELEKTLDDNLTKHKKNLLNEQSDKLRKCEIKLIKLERNLQLLTHKSEQTFEKTKMRLKLGF